MTEYVKPIVALSVYGSGTDCTNGGVSGGDTRTLYLYPRYVTLEQIEPAKRPFAVEVEVRNLGSRNLVTVIPCIEPPGQVVGPMFGGNYAATSDSRFAEEIRKCGGRDFYGAVAIHDRYETVAEYASLSR